MPRFPSQLSIRLGVLLCVLLAGSTMGFNYLYRSHMRDGMAPKMGESIGAIIRTLKSDLHRTSAADRTAAKRARRFFSCSAASSRICR